MDALSTDQNDLIYSDQPPVLIAGSSAEALRKAEMTVAASGLRVADSVALDSARDRIGRQAAATALWVELDTDAGGAMDALLDDVNRDVADGRYCAVVSAPM